MYALKRQSGGRLVARLLTKRLCLSRNCKRLRDDSTWLSDAQTAETDAKGGGPVKLRRRRCELRSGPPKWISRAKLRLRTACHVGSGGTRLPTVEEEKACDGFLRVSVSISLMTSSGAVWIDGSSLRAL
eukprot:387683-Amphidinium_carterae.1